MSPHIVKLDGSLQPLHRRASIKLDNFLPSRPSRSDLKKRNIMLSEGDTIDTIREKRCRASLLTKKLQKDQCQTKLV